MEIPQLFFSDEVSWCHEYKESYAQFRAVTNYFLSCNHSVEPAGHEYQGVIRSSVVVSSIDLFKRVTHSATNKQTTYSGCLPGVNIRFYFLAFYVSNAPGLQYQYQQSESMWSRQKARGKGRRCKQEQRSDEEEKTWVFVGAPIPTTRMWTDKAKTQHPIVWKEGGQVTAWLHVPWRWPASLVATVTSRYPRDWQKGL